MTATPAPRAKDVVAWAPMVTIKGVTRIDAWNIRPRRADVLASLGRDNWRRYYEPKGWRMPAGAIYVGRPSRWGNPWKAEVVDGVGWCCTDTRSGLIVQARDAADAHDLAVSHYRVWIRQNDAEGFAASARAELRGKTLCCWCPPHLACHADVLLEIANG